MRCPTTPSKLVSMMHSTTKVCRKVRDTEDFLLSSESQGRQNEVQAKPVPHSMQVGLAAISHDAWCMPCPML
jgi:hypothetical protein